MYLPSVSLLHIMVDTVCTGLQRSEGPNCRKSPLTTSSIQHAPLVQQLGITFILCSVSECECVCVCVCVCVVKGEEGKGFINPRKFVYADVSHMDVHLLVAIFFFTKVRDSRKNCSTSERWSRMCRANLLTWFISRDCNSQCRRSDISSELGWREVQQQQSVLPPPFLFLSSPSPPIFPLFPLLLPSSYLASWRRSRCLSSALLFSSSNSRTTTPSDCSKPCTFS